MPSKSAPPSFHELAKTWVRRGAVLAREAVEAIAPATPPPGIETQIAALEKDLAHALAGGGDVDNAARAAGEAHPDAFWGAAERLAESVDREAWAVLTPALDHLDVVRRERGRLKHLSAWARALAARRLGLLHDATSIEALRAVMARGPKLATLTAALALARMGDLEALRWLLEHPQATAGLGRHQLVALLKRFGPDGTPFLGDAVRHWEVDAPIHLAAIEALGVARERGAVDPLLRLLKEGRPEARVAAARALGGIGDASASAQLIEALDDYTWAVRAQAARSLGTLGAVESVPRLVARLSDQMWWVRHHAGYALGALGLDGRRALEAMARSERDRFAADMAAEVLDTLNASPEGRVHVA